MNLISLLKEFKNPDSPRISGDLPILPKKKRDWEVKQDPIRWHKIFKIKSNDKFNEFIFNVLEFQNETNHHAKMIVMYPKIQIEVWTHGLMDITEIDNEWIETCDDIYKEVMVNEK